MSNHDATTRYWLPGSQIVYREVWQDKVWTARPVTVVQDTPDLAVLYFAKGARWKVPAGRREQYFEYLRTGKWTLADVEWTHGDTLFMIRPGEAHAVHVMWKAVNREFAGWYINLQEPARQTATGFDFMDQELDIVVKPDLSGWAWKDEEHLARAQAGGRYSAGQVAEIWAEGWRVVERIKAKASPFCDGWQAWTPPEEWTTPALPDGWDRLAM